MSSSSSDSDSDEYEPIRKIKINIRPKEEIIAKPAADVNEIRASVEAWRPLGPPPHPSLSRRQSSLSSIVSYSGSAASFGGGAINLNHSNGYTLSRFANRTGGHLTGPVNVTTNNGGGSMTSNNSNHIGFEALGSNSGSGTVGGGSTISSSPSCSSLVNDFNNRSSFPNFIYTNSRTSSPSSNIISSIEDTKPIAIAIQETIELLIKKCQLETAFKLDNEPGYESRSFGNMKIAFSNSFAKGCGSTLRSLPPLRLRIHSAERIVKYFASRLIKDLDFGSHNVAGASDAIGQIGSAHNNLLNSNGRQTNAADPFDSGTSSPGTPTNSRVVELDMEALANQLKTLYEQSPKSRYYSLDILRYQIAPITSIEACPLQVCAYWNIERNLVKLRVDFKHSDVSGLKLKRLNNISFIVDFSSLIPVGVGVTTKPYSDKNETTASPGSCSNGSNKLLSIHDNASPSASSTSSVGTVANAIPSVSLIDCDNLFDHQQLAPPTTGPLVTGSVEHHKSPPLTATAQLDPFQPETTTTTNFVGPTQPVPSLSSTIDPLIPQSSSMFDNSSDNLFVGNNLPFTPTISTIVPTTEHQPTTIQNGYSSKVLASVESNLPCLTYKPDANWNSNNKQLVWKFDSLVPFYQGDKLCSLFAKLDFRNYNTTNEMPKISLENCQASPVDVKFLVTDSSLSKVHLALDSPGYKLVTLKSEVRSGKYRCEPYSVTT